MRPSPRAWPAAGPVRLWAPGAARVDLLRGPGAVPEPMVRDGRSWVGPVLEHGEDYAFSLDGGPSRPDPRSPWQPAGVHAASRWYDPGHHEWADGGWSGRDVRGGVVYELHLGTFTPDGTLDAAAERLDHLVDLGVDVVELMPVAAFPGRHGWGYDGVALYAVHEPYGGPAALARFVDAAHGRGLAVCLDVVHNHLGPSGNYLSEFGPYFTQAHHTPWGPAVNLDGPDAGPVRAFVVDNALHWLREFHLDALRLDAVHELIDDSRPHLLAELSDAVADLSRQVGRPLSLVAESDRNDVATITPTRAGGLGMTAQWADDVHHAVHALVTGEHAGYYVDFGSPSVVAKALTRAFVHDGTWSTIRGQVWGRPVPPGTDGHRFVVCASNHDQVGNRSTGDRPSQSLDPGLLAVSAALILTSPFTPMIFMGEEWGAGTPWQFFTDHSEPELVEAIRNGRAEEFAGYGWAELGGHDAPMPDPQSPRTVRDSTLDWSEPSHTPHARLLAFYRRLIAVRTATPDLSDGDLDRVRVRHEGDWLVMARGSVATLVSWSDGPCRIPLEAAGGEVLAAWDDVEPVVDRAGAAVVLPGPGAVVVRLRPGVTAGA